MSSEPADWGGIVGGTGAVVERSSGFGVEKGVGWPGLGGGGWGWGGVGWVVPYTQNGNAVP